MPVLRTNLHFMTNARSRRNLTVAHERRAHRIVEMFIRYVHTQRDPVCQMAELVAGRHKTISETRPVTEATV